MEIGILQGWWCGGLFKFVSPSLQLFFFCFFWNLWSVFWYTFFEKKPLQSEQPYLGGGCLIYIFFKYIYLFLEFWNLGDSYYVWFQSFDKFRNVFAIRIPTIGVNFPKLRFFSPSLVVFKVFFFQFLDIKICFLFVVFILNRVCFLTFYLNHHLGCGGTFWWSRCMTHN